MAGPRPEGPPNEEEPVCLLLPQVRPCAIPPRVQELLFEGVRRSLHCAAASRVPKTPLLSGFQRACNQASAAALRSGVVRAPYRFEKMSRTGLSPWHRPPRPSLDRGPVRVRVRRAFVGSGLEVMSTSEIMQWTRFYVRRQALSPGWTQRPHRTWQDRLAQPAIKVVVAHQISLSADEPAGKAPLSSLRIFTDCHGSCARAERVSESGFTDSQGR